MKERLRELGEELRKSCPDNDCTIYLYYYNRYEAISGDLQNPLLSEPSKGVLQYELKKIESDMERMYITNYAIHLYKNKKA